MEPATLAIRFPLLARIDTPEDLRKLPKERLPELAAELRTFILESVAKTGGHLASNLGAVELTIALHYVYDTPFDRLVWDVGHQCYPHKILTGRRDRFHTLRQWGGIAGFPKRDESPYDTFGVGHSSTSISAALGMAVAAKARGESRHVVAVIGDGAMSAGMAFEALNNAGDMEGIDLTVILNDNEMSISPPVGALTKILARLLTGEPYRTAREIGSSLLSAAPPLKAFARRVEEHMIGMLTPGTLFEEFGFRYIGPIDGHDLTTLVPTLENLRETGGLQFVHVVTKKGQGYKLAEADPIRYHGVSRFDPKAGLPEPAPQPAPTKPPTYTEVFGQWLCAMAERDPLLIGITPAMREGSGLVAFSERFPDRYFDVGIAEQHAVTFAAGLACEGFHPVVAIYSTFLQRAYDQLIHDVALQNLNVTFAIDRGGLVGADGPTHHGAFDLSYLSCIPNLIVMAPSDEAECWRLLTTAYTYEGPAAVRYPRGTGPGAPLPTALEPLPIGKARVVREGKRLAILAFGAPLAAARPVAEALDATLVDMRFVKPLDAELLDALCETHDLFVTVEENAVIGGAGSEVARLLESRPTPPRLLRLGLADRFYPHGDPQKLLACAGLDSESLHRAIDDFYRTSP
ncbi:1-deoxy-D-xylulose-5-phosphate synthase [Hydrogenophilus thermoluteolus]|uniref:1-deoxy-D-xylulose-5-phosphate synthase n=1 Tax=Hydrogenophilus thermoluteolus TaxID=297 RepID=A0A2Z6DVW1_HYDTE|nr:1-deoxy-D-xylulose-5-phosphate synthase [Hydrogenophilus thermoluteolus]BBD76587.1 1-deoxy-D-xylulose 5-phosphate synthase [Hydrogenophilus thermoluteolus]